MNIDDYLTLLLNGFVKYPKYLPDYLYRECKDANKKLISYEEFFEGLRDAMDLLINIIQKQDFKRRLEVGQIKEMRKAEGLPTEDLDNDSTNYSVNLDSLTGGAFHGHLFGEDILKLSAASLKAVKKIQNESTIRTEIDASQAINNKGDFTPISNKTNEPKITKKVIALLCYYNRKGVTRNNQDEIAKQFGHLNGGRLYQEYLYFMVNANRLATEQLTTKTTQKNRIKDFEQVISLLEGASKEKAKDELDIILSKFKESNMI